jgi:hypothetical protein
MRAILSVFIGLVLLAAGLSEARQRKSRHEVRDRHADQGAAMRLLPGGGGQSHVAGGFCGLFSEHLVGNHFCLNGDGTQRSGMTDGGTAMRLVDAGTPTTYTAPLCPSGPNCAAVSSQRISSGNSFRTAAVLPPAGDFSACATMRADALPAQVTIFGKDVSGNRGVQFRVSTAGTPTVVLYKDNTSFTSAAAAAGSFIARAPNHVCLTYDFVEDGTSEMRLYVNGAASGTPVTNAVGPVNAVETYWAIGQREFAANEDWWTGLADNAFLTEKVLTPAIIQDMARASLGYLSGSWGEAVTFARTSAASCYDESGQYLTQLPANRPCVSRMSLAGRPAWTNYLIRNDDYGTSWNRPNIQVTADALVAPDGSKTADRVVQATSSSLSINQSFTASSSGERWSCAVWVGGEGVSDFAFGIRNATAAAWPTQTASVLVGQGAVSGSAANFVTVTELPTDGGLTRLCTSTDFATDGGAYSFFMYPAGTSAGNIDAGAFLAQSICSPTPYCPDDCGPTAGTSLACTAETATVPTTGWPVEAGEACVTYRPVAVPSGSLRLVTAETAAPNGWALIAAATSAALFLSDGVATTATTGNITWVPGTTYRVCGRWGNGSAYVYVNGALMGSTIGTQRTPTVIAATAGVGATTNGFLQANGSITDLRVSH